MDLKTLADQSGLSVREIAKRVGRSSGTISSVINGNYSSANLELIRQAIIDVCQEGAAKITESDYVIAQKNAFLTASQQFSIDRLERVLASGMAFFEVILGESGTGKTTAMTTFCEGRKDVLYVKARENQSVSMLARMLVKATGEKRAKGNADELCAAFCDACLSTGVAMVVIDEADLWVHGSDEAFGRKVELIREVYESGVTVVLVGLPELKKRIAKLGGYVQNRITSGESMTVDVSELIEFGQNKGLEYAETLAKRAANYGYLRMVAKVMQNMELGYSEREAITLLGMVKI
jgi:DNA transposition AAA+ family ATPase